MSTKTQRHEITEKKTWLLPALCLCASVFPCSLLSSAAEPKSEPYTWKNVKVVAGGYIPGIIFSRAERGLAYCRTDIGGCYRWDDSVKKWIPMHDQIAESSYFGGESIAADPVDANVVYIAAGMYSRDPAAILRSRDRGKTWEIFPVPFHMGGNEDGRDMGERLAIDPHERTTLYFGSRHDGLWRSRDAGATWSKVQSFPVKGLGNPAPPTRTHAGLSFVVIDSTGQHIFVGSADPGAQHLFRSDDAGETWRAIDGAPSSKLLPLKAQLDAHQNLFITYGNAIGPNGITDGAVWKLDTNANTWTDITPDKSPGRAAGGYCGISVSDDGQTLAVTTLDRWHGVDTVWRSADSGKSWHNLADKSTRDVSASPYLFWGDPQPKLGWWMSALAVDPFDPDHAAYATGATLYACNDFSNVSKEEPTHWRVWADGIEETAILTLMSSTAGAHLLSGFGDIGGFVHEDLDRSPARGMYDHPIFNNTNTLDYAERNPKVIVRSGQPHGGQGTLAWSEDGGESWQPMAMPAQAQQAGGRRPATPALIVSADGSTFMLMTRTPLITRDRGKTWSEVKGLPDGARPIADRMDSNAFDALDFTGAVLYKSTDAGATFSAMPTTGLPRNIAGDAPTWHEAAWPLIASPGKSGDLWFVSRSGLFYLNHDARWQKIDSDLHVEAISFGKPPAGKDEPAIFAIGTMSDLKAIWRSDDTGATWVRLNDDQHEYGRRFRCISGDPRIFGRVYVGTDGRGILYADRKG